MGQEGTKRKVIKSPNEVKYNGRYGRYSKRHTNYISIMGGGGE